MGNATIFAGSKIKALKDRLSLNDVSDIMTVTADPSQFNFGSAPIGSLALDYISGKLYRKVNVQTYGWAEVSNQNLNYISNGNADYIPDWSCYNDGASASAPVDGIDGVPSVSFNRSTTTPLRGSADFNFVKDAVDRRGQGAYSNFTIDSADQAKVLTISFDYEIVSGTYSTGDLTVYIIQDTSGTPIAVQPAGYQIQSATVGTKMRHIATFQTARNVTNYRLCIHVATTSASAYTVAVDNVVVSPQVVQYGAPVTDWQDFPSVAAGTLITGTSSSPSYGSTTHNKAQWRRVGGNMEIRWDYRQTTAGGAGSGAYLFNLPGGYSIDTTKVTATTGTSTNDAASMSASVVGSGGVIAVGSTAGTLLPQVYDTTRLKLCIIPDASQAYAYASSSFASFSTSSLTFNFNASVPILGWSSSVQMSNDTDTRVVAARYYQASNTTQGANFLDWPTKDFDTHSAATTGSNVWKYTIPVAGTYRVTVEFSGVANSSIYLYKNGSQVTAGRLFFSQSTGNGNGSQTVSCVSGDYLQVNSGGAYLYNGAICIERLSGPSAIAASEQIAASYWASANGTSTTATPINFDSKEFDTHGAVTTGASWKFTAPRSDVYVLGFVSNHSATTTTYYLLYKNGVAYKLMNYTTATGFGYSASTEVQLNAGDYIDIRTSSSTPYAGGTLSATTSSNFWIRTR